MINSRHSASYCTSKIIQQIDYFLACLFGIVGIFGSLHSLEFDRISYGQAIAQIFISVTLLYLFHRYGFRAIVRVIRRIRKNRQAHRIFYHGNL